MTKILLRNVFEADLPILFEQQIDPKAIAMAAFPSKDRGPFMLHWEKIMKDKNVITKAIIYKGKLAGHIVCWKEKYEQQVGYWLGQSFWGRGIASSALTEFVNEVKIRPLYAHVANRNMASRRVLEKCGFTMHDEGREESILKLSV